MTTNCIFKNRQLPTYNIANKGFSGMRKVAARFNFSCIMIGNRPQSLTGHFVKRYKQWYKTTILTVNKIAG
jgi:hypothetical protein